MRELLNRYNFFKIGTAAVGMTSSVVEIGDTIGFRSDLVETKSSLGKRESAFILRKAGSEMSLKCEKLGLNPEKVYKIVGQCNVGMRHVNDSVLESIILG
jgi:hypothetical protein